MIRAVFFDLDDTLIDHSGAERSAAMRFFDHVEDRTSARSAEQFANDWHAVQERHVQRFLAGGFTFQEQRRARIRDVLHGDVPQAEADSLFSIYLKHYEDSWRCFGDVDPCLRALRVEHMGVVTNGDAHQQVQKLMRTGLADRFEHVIVSGALGHAKPDARIFHAACERVGVAPSEAVHIGDSVLADYRGARDAGLHAILIDREGRHGSDDGIRIVRDLTEVASVLPSL